MADDPGAEVSLRPVTSATWRSTLALRVRAEQLRFVADSQPIALVMLAKAYVRPGGLTWAPYAIFLGDEPVGMLQVADNPSGDADTCWLYHFFVDAGRQGRGIGTAALRAALALIAREHPAAREVRLTVHPDNAAARRLYEREGFRVTGEQRDGEDVFVWGLSRQ